MHIPDGAVSAQVNLTTFVLSGVTCAVAAARAGRTLGDRQTPLLGMTAAFVFAAQMLNFPVAGGTSGHFMGAVLAALLLGPLNACLVMAVVLAVQALVFSDGGVTALGSNLFNMGIVGGLGGWLVFASMRAALPRTRTAFLTAAAVAAWLSVMIAACACAVELALSGTSPLAVVLPAMAGVHALIGIGESFITVTVLSTVLAIRPDLVAAWPGRAEEAAHG